MCSSLETLSRIARVIAERVGANVTAEELRRATRLDQLIGLDSIAALELVVGLEREFAIRFEPACMDREFLMDLIGLVNYLDQKCGVQQQ